MTSDSPSLPLTSYPLQKVPWLICGALARLRWKYKKTSQVSKEGYSCSEQYGLPLALLALKQQSVYNFYRSQFIRRHQDAISKSLS